MADSSGFPVSGRLALLVVLVVATSAPTARADTILLKNGAAYRGTVDRDETIVWIYDGLKRVVIRNSKISKIQPDASLSNFEVFRVVQPLTVHSGAMPKEVVRTFAEPWSDRGRRRFEYEGAKLGKMIRMEQAIYELGPYMSAIRGVDIFWKSQIATAEIPREIVLSILGKVDRSVESERFRVARFLIQSEWFDDASKELDYLITKFPEDEHLKERIEPIRASILQLQSIKTKASIDRAKVANQPKLMESLIKSIVLDKVSPELADAVGEIDRNLTAQKDADKSTIEDLNTLAKKLSPEVFKGWKTRFDGLIKAMNEVPEVVRDALTPWRTAAFEGGKPPEEEFALAMSSYLAGAEGAVNSLEEAKALWDLRDLIQTYLTTPRESTRLETLSMIESVNLKTGDAELDPVKKMEALTRIVQHMPPPGVPDPSPKKEAGKPAQPAETVFTHQLLEEGNDVPTDYMVALPPEYHPLRSYPAILALHDGTGPSQAIAWWKAEAARRGYIVIAPDYLLPGQKEEYHYSSSEHAAAILALRDAKRRYSIDSDRVFVGGQFLGANMAWDFGLSHPDLVAGSVVISGMPFKYVNRYLNHTELVPLYVTLADLAPAANEVVFGVILKPLIAKALDVTYNEYLKRGPEAFPEEAPAVFDWMDRRRRDPFPKNYDVVAARSSDNRFFGAVVQEYDEKRMTHPDAVDGFGKGLNPATIKFKSSSLSNLVEYTTSGVQRVDVWLSPAVVNFNKRLEVRINRKARFKGLAKPDIGSFLEDLRIRGDRQQLYWLKISAG